MSIELFNPAKLRNSHAFLTHLLYMCVWHFSEHDASLVKRSCEYRFAKMLLHTELVLILPARGKWRRGLKVVLCALSLYCVFACVCIFYFFYFTYLFVLLQTAYVHTSVYINTYEAVARIFLAAAQQQPLRSPFNRLKLWVCVFRL